MVTGWSWASNLEFVFESPYTALMETCSVVTQEQSSYSLTVEAKDRNGEAIGRGQATTVQIKVLDVNDNIPVLEKVTVSISSGHEISGSY